MTNRILEFVKKIEGMLKRPLSVAFLGYGATNKRIFERLSELKPDISYSIRINEKRCSKGDRDIPNKAVIIDGANAFLDICEDIVFTSPSVRRDRLSFTSDRAHYITSDTELFFQSTPRDTFLVTGSNGKSTVADMARKILTASGRRTFIGGNFGTPLTELHINEYDSYVIELSSFSLMYSVPASKRAVITNISENHLDWHKDYREYIESKYHICKGCDELITNADDEKCRIFLPKAPFAAVSSLYSTRELSAMYPHSHILTAEKGRIYIDGTASIDLLNTRIITRHNVHNLMTAAALTLGYASVSEIEKIASEYIFLPHRCERFLTCNGIDCIDSSIDTTPERTASTLSGLERRVKILMGGHGKGLSYTPLIPILKKYADTVILYGDEGKRLLQIIEADSELSGVPHEYFYGFDEAVMHIVSIARSGDTVILSPAAASYGEFENFTARGNRFKDITKRKLQQ